MQWNEKDIATETVDVVIVVDVAEVAVIARARAMVVGVGAEVRRRREQEGPTVEVPRVLEAQGAPVKNKTVEDETWF